MHVTELLEVPGRSKHPRARSCLYVPADAILLVHNQAFPKSYTRLYVWLKEIQEALERGRSPGANTSLPPILVVGTHSPLTNGNNNQIGRCPIAEETGGFSISIDLMDPSSEPRLNDVLQGLWYRILG